MDRYQRQVLLKEIGLQGQVKIRTASALIVGCGGLGSVNAVYLTGAGIGKLGLVDFDKVSLTNLHRQIIYKTNDIGKDKVECAKNNLSALNNEVQIETFNIKATASSVIELSKNYDILVDCSDNSATRYILDNASKILKKPLVYGGIDNYIGQVSVFNYKTCFGYNELFPKGDASHQQESDSGVIGILPGIIGCLQANEVLKIITEFGDVLCGKLLEYDIRTNSQTIYNLM